MSKRGSHLRVSSTLAAGIAGLAVTAFWINGIKTYACDEGVPGPSGWAYTGLLLFALGIVVVGCLGALLTEARRSVQSVYIAIAVVEGATAVMLVVWLLGKYGHYNCG